MFRWKVMLLIWLIIFTFSCDQMDQEDFEIQGSWQWIKGDYELYYGVGCVDFDRTENPFIIHINDSTIQDDLGVIYHEDFNLSMNYEWPYSQIGNLLEVYNADRNLVDTLEIVLSTSDSLVIKSQNGRSYYSRYHPKLYKNKVNRIIINVQDGQAYCPDYNLEINLSAPSYIRINNGVARKFEDEFLKEYVYRKVSEMDLASLNGVDQFNIITDSHSRYASFFFLNNTDTVKNVNITSAYGPTNLKKILLSVDAVVKASDQNTED
ncbi:hypothetical protein [Fulvivirga ligni]|uniref:hypothetical protein n=1 Tax=Fulvivirga ligni TaxID=2904246 RepID=UPI001F1B27B1|nr:hypothetical protein [Fulvivirga ligni]UII20383.1 hypothetical protein LVD16_21305 [Fulvivirga ligni]